MSKQGIIGVIVFWFVVIGFTALGFYNTDYLINVLFGIGFLVVFLVLSMAAYALGEEFK